LATLDYFNGVCLTALPDECKLALLALLLGSGSCYDYDETVFFSSFLDWLDSAWTYSLIGSVCISRLLNVGYIVWHSTSTFSISIESSSSSSIAANIPIFFFYPSLV